MHLHLAKKYFFVCIVIILSLAFTLRVFELNTNPPGFFADEAAIGFNAYKLLTTGADEYKVPFPLFFKSFGDYRLPIPIYANIPFVLILGLHETTIRLTAIVFSLISILFLILVGKEIYNEPVGILAGFLTAISPWHIQLSRWGSEYIYFPAIFLIGLYFFLKSLKNASFLSYAFFFFALSLYTYYPTLIVTPIFVCGLIIFFLVRKGQKNKWSETALATAIFIAMCLPLFIAFHNGTLLTRWNSVSTSKLSLQKQLEQGLQTYALHFSPDFLFLKGDTYMPGHFITRHSVKGFGEMFLFEFPFLLVGFLLTCIKSIRSKKLFLILFLLLLYPVGSAITHDGPLVTRSVIGIIPFMLLCAIGIDFFLEKKFFLAHKRRIFFLFGNFVFFIFIGITLFKYFTALYTTYPLISANFWGWQYGARDIVNYFVSQQNYYEEEIMAPEFNAPSIFFKFYAPNDCLKCRIGLPDKLYKPGKKQLFALAPRYFLKYPKTHINIKQVIFYPDHSVAFLIGEIVE